MKSLGSRKQHGATSSGRAAWLAIGVPIVLVIASTVLVALEPWNRPASSEPTSTPTPSPRDSASRAVQRAELPEDLCEFLGYGLIEPLLLTTPKTGRPATSSSTEKSASCVLEETGKVADAVVTIRAGVKRVSGDDGPLERARELYDKRCDQLEDDNPPEAFTRPIEDTMPVGDDVCGKVDIDGYHDNVTARLVAVDGPDVIEVEYARINISIAPEINEEYALDLARGFLEKLRG